MLNAALIFAAVTSAVIAVGKWIEVRTLKADKSILCERALREERSKDWLQRERDGLFDQLQAARHHIQSQEKKTAFWKQQAAAWERAAKPKLDETRYLGEPCEPSPE